MSQEALDTITDKILAYDADKPKGALKVIAGAPDRPLIIGDIEIPCYVLEDETRVLAQRGMAVGLGMSPSAGGQRFREFVTSKRLIPHVSNTLRLGIDGPIVFQNPSGGGVAHGYPASLLVDVCNAVLVARDKGALTRQQSHIVERCDLLIRALATVGIIALVDEATGYQRIREERALATILEKFIDKELRRWTKTFPFEFYQEICRLKGWPSINAVRRPSVIGRYTNDIVYDRLAPGILDELKRINPVQPSGYRRHKHHQWFTPDIGHPKLREHIAGVMAVMRLSATWDGFRRNLYKAFPKPGDQSALDFEIPGED